MVGLKFETFFKTIIFHKNKILPQVWFSHSFISQIKMYVYDILGAFICLLHGLAFLKWNAFQTLIFLEIVQEYATQFLIFSF